MSQANVEPDVPLDRLNTLGVDFNQRPPVYLWLKNEFHIQGEPLNPRSRTDIEAAVFRLAPGGPQNPPFEVPTIATS